MGNQGWRMRSDARSQTDADTPFLRTLTMNPSYNARTLLALSEFNFTRLIFPQNDYLPDDFEYGSLSTVTGVGRSRRLTMCVQDMDRMLFSIETDLISCQLRLEVEIALGESTLYTKGEELVPAARLAELKERAQRYDQEVTRIAARRALLGRLNKTLTERREFRATFSSSSDEPAYQDRVRSALRTQDWAETRTAAERRSKLALLLRWREKEEGWHPSNLREMKAGGLDERRLLSKGKDPWESPAPKLLKRKRGTDEVPSVGPSQQPQQKAVATSGTTTTAKATTTATSTTTAAAATIASPAATTPTKLPQQQQQPKQPKPPKQPPATTAPKAATTTKPATVIVVDAPAPTTRPQSPQLQQQAPQVQAQQPPSSSVEVLLSPAELEARGAAWKAYHDAQRRISQLQQSIAAFRAKGIVTSIELRDATAEGIELEALQALSKPLDIPLAQRRSAQRAPFSSLASSSSVQDVRETGGDDYGDEEEDEPLTRHRPKRLRQGSSFVDSEGNKEADGKE
jgi:hypothetical protein